MTIYEQLHHAIFDGLDNMCTEESSNIELLPIEASQEELYESIDINETKNIPKNYGKAIISFASKSNAEVKHIA